MKIRDFKSKAIGETCRCGHDEASLRWQMFGGQQNRKHIRASCSACGKFIGWAPMTKENKQEADEAETNRKEYENYGN